MSKDIDIGIIEKNTATFEEQQLVIFKVAGEEFGVNINEVKEIIRWEEVTRIPNAETYIKGVINLRGNIIVVNDLAMKLGLPSKTIDDDTRILVVEVGNNTVGMIVDSATEVMRLPGNDIRAAPSMITSTIDNNYIDGVGLLDEKRLLTLLDLGKVLESKDFEKIIQAQQIAERNIHNIKDIKEKKQETETEEKTMKPELESEPKAEPLTKTTEEENKPSKTTEDEADKKDDENETMEVEPIETKKQEDKINK